MSKTIIKVISWVLIVLVIVALIGVVAKFTGGFTSDFKTFYVTVDGKDIMTTTNGYMVSPKNPMKVDIKYTFAGESDENGYSVKVVPNVIEAEDFDFTLDGEVYSYQGEKDVTKGFNIQYDETSFTISPKGVNTQEILQAVYPNNTIGDCVDKGYENMYSLIITSYNGESSVIINFSVASAVTGITLDPEVIVF